MNDFGPKKERKLDDNYDKKYGNWNIWYTKLINIVLDARRLASSFFLCFNFLDLEEVESAER